MAAVTPLTAFPTAGNNPVTDDHGIVLCETGASSQTNALEVFGLVTAGAGTGQLIKWQGDANSGHGRWYPYGTTFVVDVGVNGGLFQARFDLHINHRDIYHLLLNGGPFTVTEAFINPLRL